MKEDTDIRACLRKPTSRRLGFAGNRFHTDLRFVCAERATSLRVVCEEIGVHRHTVSAMRGGVGTPDGASLAALCKWSGLNAAEYSIDMEAIR